MCIRDRRDPVRGRPAVRRRAATPRSARAFAHAERLLVLDDATSSLDTVTELNVTHALLHDVKATTRIVIAHRAATAARADLVAWLDDGRIRALAPHAELWDLPAYRALFATAPKETAHV